MIQFGKELEKFNWFWSLIDCNWTLTQNDLVCKQALNHLAKLAKWLSCFEYLSVRCIWLYVLVMSYTCHIFFESCCSHLNFGFRTCFEQGVPWHSGNCSVWIHSQMRTWHDKNIQSVKINICRSSKKRRVCGSNIYVWETLNSQYSY